ncbi:MAG TPA: SIS domain-containing protein [Oscillospiraceae bacterium]|nr:SIS domain-containing protein [Oscillospiraceae bacterium]
MTEERRVLESFINRYHAVKDLQADILEAFDILKACFDSGGKLLVCGNGGSAADSEHIVGELMKSFKLQRKLGTDEKALFGEEKILAEGLQNALPAIALTAHSALVTAIANDNSADLIFAQQVWAYAKNSSDVLLAISTSGNSENVLNAVKTAKALGRKSIAITGADGGKIGEIATVTLRIPESETYLTQELMLPLYHCLCAMLEIHYFS